MSSPKPQLFSVCWVNLLPSLFPSCIFLGGSADFTDGFGVFQIKKIHGILSNAIFLKNLP